MAKKQAVLLIHGIGEQIPMDTLRGFVDAVWSKHTAIHHRFGDKTVWSKPDDISGNFELRRLTTGRNRAGIRTDFFEFYWANLAQDTTMSQVTSWLRLLVLRRPSRIPAPLKPVWWLFAASASAIAATLTAYGMPDASHWILSGLLGSIAPALLAGFLVSYVGDAARYLHGSPANVDHRQRIRSKGIEILKKLQESGEYQRIIVVGHSLGSVIGYDILTYLWAIRAKPPASAPGTEPETSALNRLVELSRNPPLSLQAYREAQTEYWRELQANGDNWLISDFITLGSPLTYADFLLAKDQADLHTKQEARELPTCPPALEKTRSGLTFAHAPNSRKGSKPSIPHHAAVFGPTRWTNLYFPTQYLVKGDLIGGPLAPMFGQGIYDIPVETPIRRGYFSHTLYWDLLRGDQTTLAVDRLREVLGLANYDSWPKKTRTKTDPI
jgi:hypothetical protein